MAGKVGRPRGDTKFDAWARAAFLRNLAETGRLYDSAEAAGVCYTTMRSFREGGTRHDPVFEQQVQDALDEYRDRLRAEIHRRGVEGWVERGIYGKEGEHLGDVVKYSDRLLELLAKRHDPAFRDHVHVDAQTRNTSRVTHDVDVEKTLRALSPEGRAALRRALQELAAPAAAEEEEAAPCRT